MTLRHMQEAFCTEECHRGHQFDRKYAIFYVSCVLAGSGKVGDRSIKYWSLKRTNAILGTEEAPSFVCLEWLSYSMCGAGAVDGRIFLFQNKRLVRLHHGEQARTRARMWVLLCHCARLILQGTRDLVLLASLHVIISSEETHQKCALTRIVSLQQRIVMAHHESPVFAISVSYDQQVLATCGGDSMIRIYDMRMKKVLAVMVAVDLLLPDFPPFSDKEEFRQQAGTRLGYFTLKSGETLADLKSVLMHKVCDSSLCTSKFIHLLEQDM